MVGRLILLQSSVYRFGGLIAIMESVAHVNFEKGNETLPVELNLDFSLKTLFGNFTHAYDDMMTTSIIQLVLV